VIDGLKLTVTGRELRAHLAARVDAYQRKAEKFTKQLREPSATYRIPDEVLKSEISSAEDRAELFAFMRDHITEVEVYLLCKSDLEFAELLPEEPEWVRCGGGYVSSR
jgi:hypothetical protein